MRKIFQKMAVATIIFVIVFALNFSFLAAPAVALSDRPKVYPVFSPCPISPTLPGRPKPEEFPVGLKPFYPGYQPLPFPYSGGSGYPRPFPYSGGSGYPRPFPYSGGSGYPRPCYCGTRAQSSQKPQTETTSNPTRAIGTIGTQRGQKPQTETTSNPTASPGGTDTERGELKAVTGSRPKFLAINHHLPSLVRLTCLVVLSGGGILLYILYKHNRQTKNSSQGVKLMATVRTFGIWTDVTGKGNESAGNLNGVGTNQINWGIPNLPKNPEGKQSAYRFDGVESVPLPLKGTDFLLGTFNRFNYSITLRSFSLISANLNLTLEIEGGLKKEFIFLFKHNKTPNRGSLGTPDIVSIPRPQSEERVTIGGKEYSLSITGFCQDGEIVEQFTTLESQHNSAQLYGKLVEAKPLLEPSLQVSGATLPQEESVEPPRSEPVPTAAPPDQHLTIPQPLQVPPQSSFPPITLLGQPGFTLEPSLQVSGATLPQEESVEPPRSEPVPTAAPPDQHLTIPQPLQVPPQSSFPPITLLGQPGFTLPGQSGGIVSPQAGVITSLQPNLAMPATGEVVQLRPLIVTLTSSGLWSSVIEQVAGACYINGVGTNQISWGTSSNPQGFLSAYRFDGMDTRSVPLQGSAFVLGNFIHYNYPISGYGICSVTLKLTLNINDTNVEFNFQFAHQETINEGVNGVCPVTPGYAPPCPDVVTLVCLQSQEIVTINGKPYVLYILGFLQNGQIVNQFITFKNQINSAQLFGKFVEVQSPSTVRPLL